MISISRNHISSQNSRIRVTHIITGLGTGGAEMMLAKLLAKTDRSMFEPCVISLLRAGPVAERIKALGIPVHSLEMTRGSIQPFAAYRLARLLRASRPDIVQTWMYHADLFGGIAARLATSAKVIWGIRSSDLDPITSKRRTIFIAKMCAQLSRVIPHRIVSCSETALDVHARMGYEADRMIVIPNGFDIAAYRADTERRRAFRTGIGIPDSARLVGLIARNDPQKDHQTFLSAARIVRSTRDDVHFVLCGDGVTPSKLAAEDLGDNFHLLGRRDDIPNVLAALDILALSSAYGEGFPNVVGEAMACEVPCVVTDVGDSAQIVGNTGYVVRPRDAQAFAKALAIAIDEVPEKRVARGKAARNRVLENFELKHIVALYEKLYLELFSGRR